MGLKTMYTVEGMSCEHCAARVKEAIEALEGVKSVAVNLKKKTVKVKAIQEIPTNLVVEAVEKAGYKVI